MTNKEQFEAWFNAEFNVDYWPTEAMYMAWQARGELDAKHIAELEGVIAMQRETIQTLNYRHLTHVLVGKVH